MKHSKAFLSLVEESKKNIKEISPEKVLEKKANREEFYFFDVREDNEWNAGYAQGAEHLGKGIIERDIENKVPNKDSCIVLYCGGGFRSALAADNLQKMGYSNVFSMAGGMRLWREKSLPEDKQ